MLYDRFQSKILFVNFIIQTDTDLDVSLNNILSIFCILSRTYLLYSIFRICLRHGNFYAVILGLVIRLYPIYINVCIIGRMESSRRHHNGCWQRDKIFLVSKSMKYLLVCFQFSLFLCSFKISLFIAF